MAKYQVLLTDDYTGSTLYIVFQRISDGQFFNQAGAEAFDNTRVDSFYATNLTQVGTTHIWQVDVPGTLPVTDWRVYVYLKVGGSRSMNADTPLDISDPLYWDGGTLTPSVSSARMLNILDSFGSELSAVPAANAGLISMVRLIYQWLRNNSDQSATTRRIKKADGTVVASATVTDSGSLTSQGTLS